MLTGLWFNVAGFIAYALAPTGLIFWSAIPVGALGGLSGPPMQGLMTRHVAPTEQGQLQGALGSVRGIAFMMGPLLFSSLFASFIGPIRRWHCPVLRICSRQHL
jgi:MFS transporter, DHA1 family, tetracycline resistance protein